jgi:hypothetical protein
VGVLDWKKSVFDRKYWQGILEQAKKTSRVVQLNKKKKEVETLINYQRA